MSIINVDLENPEIKDSIVTGQKLGVKLRRQLAVVCAVVPQVTQVTVH